MSNDINNPDPTDEPDLGLDFGADDPDPEPDPELDTPDLDGDEAADHDDGEFDLPPVPRPINWRTLSADDAEHEWLALNEWVTWLRHEFGLPAQVIPPAWHRHPELVWELSALYLRWQGCYDPEQDAAGPISFMTDFHAACQRLREWVQVSGTRLDRDRPTRITTWPGEDSAPEAVETPIIDRDQDFVEFVMADVQHRADAEAAFLRGKTER